MTKKPEPFKWEMDDLIQVRSVDSAYYVQLRLYIDQRIENLFSDWCKKEQKRADQWYADYKKKHAKQFTTEAARTKSFNKHANQVEKYLAGFNKILGRIK